MLGLIRAYELPQRDDPAVPDRPQIVEEPLLVEVLEMRVELDPLRDRDLVGEPPEPSPLLGPHLART